jgi:hypothetical protein
MRALLALLAMALLSVGAGACGDTSHASNRYLNDGDHDPIGDEDGDNNADNDNDVSLDYKPVTNEGGNYHDADDSMTLAYGHAAGPVDTRAVAALVKRYYAAAAAGDGKGACSMLLPSLAKAAPEDYGEFGPQYLRGGKTCEAVLSLLFEHFHNTLTAPVGVTGVRVEGNQAHALVGSATMSASYITLQRERGVWALNELLGNTLQ